MVQPSLGGLPSLYHLSCQMPIKVSEECSTGGSPEQLELFDFNTEVSPVPFPTEVKTIRSSLRSYLCFHLPQGLTLDAVKAHVERVEMAMKHFFNAPYLAVSYHAWGPTASMIHCFVPGEHDRQQISFEADGTRRFPYRQRLSAVFIFDFAGRYLYVSLPPKRHYASLEPVLRLLYEEPGSLLPLQPVEMTLVPLLTLAEAWCRPSGQGAPWMQLFLKSIAYREAGEMAEICEKRFPVDGFESLSVSEKQRYKSRVYEAKVMAKLTYNRHAMVTLRPRSSSIAINLGQEVLPMVATLLGIFSQQRVAQ